MLREQARAFHRQPPPGAIVGVSGHARRRAAFVTRRIVFYLLLGYTLCAFVTTSDSSKYAYPSPSQPPLVAPQVADVKDSVVNSLVDGGNQATSNYTKPPAASITLPFWFMSAHVLYAQRCRSSPYLRNDRRLDSTGTLNWKWIGSSIAS